MALIKPKQEIKVKEKEKTITLTVEMWRELAEYAKVVGIGGRLAEKQNYIIAEALKRVFAEDAYKKAKEEFNKETDKVDIKSKGYLPTKK